MKPQMEKDEIPKSKNQIPKGKVKVKSEPSFKNFAASSAT
jgi:hypothetical protein